MPVYDFLCQFCKRLFSKTLTIAGYDESKITCPNCGSHDVEQGRWVPFHSQPSRKSA
jgi:putative FmdB family regulatory protein